MNANEGRTIDTIEELVSLVELVGVKTYETSGRLLEQQGTQGQPGEPEMQVQARVGPNELEARLRLSLRSESAEFVADCSAIFTASEPINTGEDLQREFLERVGIMAIYPFVRELIFGTAVRMQVEAPVLGLIRPGQISLSAE